MSQNQMLMPNFPREKLAGIGENWRKLVSYWRELAKPGIELAAVGSNWRKLAGAGENRQSVGAGLTP
jgi:hypothetical protein